MKERRKAKNKKQDTAQHTTHKAQQTVKEVYMDEKIEKYILGAWQVFTLNFV